ALAAEPDLLIADEPTTALDVTIQAQILQLLSELQSKQDMSILLITHDLGVISQMSEHVGVMYAGEIIEQGTLEDIFKHNLHPYTAGLLGSIPDLENPGSRLSPIEGNVPDLYDSEMGDYCYFADRCPKAMRRCLEKPPTYQINSGTVQEEPNPDQHTAKCYLAVQDYNEADPLPENYFEDEVK
ncbi:MAG: oligopeptide/dipeptide ABC transporter ATP-binding protein, partial [Halobacteriaceae archaeon]